LNWLAYIVPPVAFLAGVLLLYLAFRSWKKTGPASTAPIPSQPDGENSPEPGQSPQTSLPPGADNEYAARLEEQLRKQR
jgi:hypothetical protein